MIDYDTYLHSEEWKKKRELVLTFWNYECAICSSDSHLHIHHRTYDRLGNEKITDLIVLCETCHDLFHSREKLTKRKRIGHFWDLRKILKGKSPVEVLQILREADRG